MSDGLKTASFIAKWAPVELSEPAASQEHFIDLCRLLGQPTPADYDPTGEEYEFARTITGTGRGPATEEIPTHRSPMVKSRAILDGSEANSDGPR